MGTQIKQDEAFIFRLVGEGKWGQRYLDIGAFHPWDCNNTCYFYRRGWRGVLYEPQPGMAALLRRERPADTVIEAAVSNFDGQGIFYGSGQLASLHPVAGRPHHLQRTVDVVSAASLSGTFSFASLDVESTESLVISTIDWSKLRVGVWMIESLGMHKEPEHLVWEPILLSQGYRFDDTPKPSRLNRFYIHRDYL